MKYMSLNHGRQFVASIMKGMETIPGSDGMWLMRGVTNLETGTVLESLVIRNVERLFWDECLNEVMTPDVRCRVCAMGSPGTGKTSSTLFLIRTLLENKHTVVYRFASEYYFWEFRWNNIYGYVVSVYPGDAGIRDVKSLRDPSTYYIVDPGASTKDCLPPTSVVAQTIIVSSSDDSDCWGRREFTKGRNDVYGIFRIFPTWDLEELLLARPYLQRTVLTDQEVEERFRLVGGFPRHIFAERENFSTLLDDQRYAIPSLTAEEAARIVEGHMDPVGSFAHNYPKSDIIGYGRTHKEGKITFWPRKVDINSPSVAEKVAEKFMPELWRLVLREDDRIGSNKMYEAYCRKLMYAAPARSFRCRPCSAKGFNESKYDIDVLLGGCKKARLERNITKAVIEGDSMTLFHSINPSQSLFDFVYKDNDGTIHAFQATLGKKHSFQMDLIQKLRETFGNSRIAFFYLIPADRFNEFVKEAANPKTDDLSSVWHVLIPDPSKEHNSSFQESRR